MNSYWRTRSPRERALLLGGAAILAAALIYVLAVAPLIAAGRKAEKALPELRRQAAEMRALAAEAGRLKTRAGTVATGAAALTESAGRLGLVAVVTAQGEGRYAVRLERAAMTALQDWLGRLQTEQRLFTREARLRPAGTGTVSAELVLAP